MGTQKSQCGLLRLRGPHSCAPTMSWLLDKASALLDAADGSAADIAKDQGFGEEENARDKVKKRKEARRAAQVKKEKNPLMESSRIQSKPQPSKGTNQPL